MSSPAPDVSLNSRSQFIRAGAGAGKTTQLIHSFSEFVKEFRQKNLRYPKVVITTFTRKATQEVKERLLVNALKEQDRGIFEYISKKSSVHISTIHGLLSLFLSQNAEELSLPQDLKIVDEIRSDRLLKKSIHSLMKKNTKYVDLLETYAFYRLVEISREALDLKYQHRNLNYVSQDILLKLTESKRQLVLKKLDQILSQVDSVPDKWKEYFQFLNGYQKLLDKKMLAEARIFFENEPKKPPFLSKNPAFDVETHHLIEEIRKEDSFDWVDSAEYRDKHEQLNQLFNDFLSQLYELDLENKKNTGELTISDLENYSLKLIQTSAKATGDFSQSWDFFMIDEYQDTSPLQVEILNHIVGDKPCFIVGDPQQSIYLFRGARSEVFDAKENELLKKKVQIKSLNTNYRSEPKLMNFINDFFKSFNQSFKPMDLKADQLDLSLSAQVFYVQTHDQALGTLKHILKLLAEGIEPKDICVLSRKNKHLIEIARLAYQYQIPVQLQAASGFESKREILDLVAFLKFLVNPFDSENLVTLLRSPWFFLDDQLLVDLAQKKESSFSIWSGLLQTNSEIYLRLADYRLSCEEIGTALTLKKFIMDSGFLSFSELLDPTGKREANIWKFLMSLTAAEKQTGFSLSLFIEDHFQSLQTDLGSSAGEAQPVVQPDRVSLMTVHAAKGLEFKHVIVVGLTDKPQITINLNLAFDPDSQLFSLAVFDEEASKLLSSAWATKVRKEFNQRELLESERVLYVAMTRAQQTISLIAEVAAPDKKKIVVSDSWFKKILWPNESFKQDKYAVDCIFYDNELEKANSTQRKILQLRSKKNEKQQIELESQSVTEIISGPPKNKDIGPYFDKQIHALKKAQRGTDLHRIFESMKYLELEELNEQLNPTEKKLVQYLQEQTQIDVQTILAKGHNEWGFGLKYSRGMLQGQIDAWAELDHEIHILDYKTGSPEYAQKAFDQLAVYTYALLQMNKVSKNKKIILSVIYPVDQRIIQKSYENAEDFNQKETSIKSLFLI